MSSGRDEGLKVVSEYFRSIEAKDIERVRALLHPEIRQSEYPNQLVKGGAERTLQDLLDGLARGSKVLKDERYTIDDALVDGDRVACRVRWQGTLEVPVLGKNAGQVLEARLGVFFRLADGKIIEQHNYDCFYL